MTTSQEATMDAAEMNPEVGPSTPRSPAIVERDATDLAATKEQVLFGLRFMGLWVAGAFACSVVGSVIDSPMAFFMLIALLSFAMLQWYIGGIGRMLTASIQHEPEQGSASAFRFLRKHWFGCIVGGGLATALVLGVMAIVLAIIGAVAHSDGSFGRFVGALAIYPTWIFVLLALPLAWNCQLLPVVMAVENCGAAKAFKSLAGRNPMWLLSSFIEVVMRCLPVLGMSLLFAGGAAAITMLATGGISEIFRSVPTPAFGGMGGYPGSAAAFGQASYEADVSLTSLLSQASYLLIAFTWVAFAAGTVASEYVIQYASKRR